MPELWNICNRSFKNYTNDKIDTEKLENTDNQKEYNPQISQLLLTSRYTCAGKKKTPS